MPHWNSKAKTAATKLPKASSVKRLSISLAEIGCKTQFAVSLLSGDIILIKGPYLGGEGFGRGRIWQRKTKQMEAAGPSSGAGCRKNTHTMIQQKVVTHLGVQNPNQRLLPEALSEPKAANRVLYSVQESSCGCSNSSTHVKEHSAAAAAAAAAATHQDT
jgi:hypothetical protein